MKVIERMKTMHKREILDILRRHQKELREMGVRSLSLFGSAARDALGPKSDIDLLVSFSSPPGFRGYMRVKFRLEELLGREVDLVMERALKEGRDQALQAELVHVA